jgi:DNA-binding response OmpR family regulator
MNHIEQFSEPILRPQLSGCPRSCVDLRPKEFLLFEYPVRKVNRPVTRTMILDHVWNSSFEGLTNVVNVYISGLRSKVDRSFPQKLIRTNRGLGYTLTCMNGFPPESTLSSGLPRACSKLD